MDEIIVEFVSQGRFVKVSAVDVRTGIETSIVGDPTAGQTELKRLAIRKLKYVLKKKLEEGKNQQRDGKPGYLV